MTPDHEVAIIGAGLGGVGMAIVLRGEGIENFVLLGRPSDIGDTSPGSPGRRSV
jgi:cation diffusion facilitator CzcD-associated flavoprotein CzcO